MRGTAEQREQTACNIVSCIFLDRTPRQIEDLDCLIQGIRDELALIKRNRLAFMFSLSIWIRKLASVRVSKSTRPLPTKCQTSLVFSNLGKLFTGSPLAKRNQKLVMGDSVLESFEILAPLSPWMFVAFIALQYADEFSLTLRFDSRVMHASVARELLTTTAEQLRNLASRSGAALA
jgi:hypothetical protein